MSALDDPGLFGRQWAATYDQPGNPDPAPAVDFLAALATGDGPVLELAIGTGRVALPLADRGVVVEGIEASPEMVARLRAKPGGAAIPVLIGDMADVAVTGGPYQLVYLVFNTLFNLTGAGRQEDCLRNVARVLALSRLIIGHPIDLRGIGEVLLRALADYALQAGCTGLRIATAGSDEPALRALDQARSALEIGLAIELV